MEVLTMPRRRKPAYRVRYIIDQEHTFEECNGEARPLTEEEYKGNEYRACPDHPRAGSKVVKAGTKSRRPVIGCAKCGRTDYADIPYPEYLAYYGNPARHVYLACIVDEQCPHCGEWQKNAASVWGIDFMDNSPEYDAISIDEAIPEEDARKLPGYAGEMAREVLTEAKA